MSRFKRNLNFYCGNCRRPLHAYIIRNNEDYGFKLPRKSKVREKKNTIELSVKCRNCGERTYFETDSPTIETAKWKRTGYTWREPLYMRCHCGLNFNVELIRTKEGKLRITKGKIRYIDGKTELTIKCNRCNEWTVFIRDEQKLDAYGWKRVERKPKKQLYEVDKTYAMLDALRKRRKRH